jgi:TPR repeat protein
MLYYGTEQTAQAIDWFRKAAAQQHAPAEFQMGQLYEFGFGVVQSDGEALTWYKRAAAHGSPAAQRAVGDCYRKGRGIASDPAEAARWYLPAAEGDDLRAQYQLAELYLNGTGVARNAAAAYFWFSVAAGQTPLEDNRKQLLELRNVAGARMTAAEVKDAARRIAAWKPGGGHVPVPKS